MAEEQTQANEQNPNDGIFGKYEDIHSAAKAVESLGSDEYQSREFPPEEDTSAESESVEEQAVEDIEEPDTDNEFIGQPAESEEGYDIDGTNVTFGELKASYQRDRKNTQGLQDFDEQRQKMGQAQNVLAQQSQQYMQALEALDKRLNDKIGKVDQGELERLRTEDPMEYFAKRDELREMEEERKTVQESAIKERQAQMSQMQAGHTELLKKEADALSKHIPEWTDPKKGGALRDKLKGYASTQGYKQEEIDTISDHRALVILRKAMLFDEIKSADAGGKKTRNAPRVQRPRGSDSRGTMGTDKRNRQNKKLKQTGRVDDAARLIFDLIE